MKKILLAATVGVASFSATSLYAEDTSSTQQQIKEQNFEIKKLIISNIDSLFPFQTQITIVKVEQKSDGTVVASNVLVMSGGKDKPNVSINSIEFTGLDFGGKVDKDFTIKAKGLSVTNLATSVASSNVVSAGVDSKNLANNNGLYSIIMNSFSQSLYDFTIEYNNEDQTLEIDTDASYNKKKLLDEKVKLADVKLADSSVNEDFLAGFKNVVFNSKIEHAYLDADITDMMKQVTTQYFGKDYQNTSNFDTEVSLDKGKGELNLVVVGKLGSKNHLKFDLAVAGMDFDHSIEDIIQNDANTLENAYIKSNDTDVNIDIDFKKSDYPKDQFMRRLFKFVGNDSVNLLVDLTHQLKGLSYDTNLKMSGGGLASIDASSKSTIDGKLKVLPYLNMQPNLDNDGLYDCKDQLCLNNLSVSFSNSGLLEQVARFTNNDPNTTPIQILNSYSALLQLFAVQQDNKFIQKGLSFLSIFMQNPKNISVTLDAKKPMNQNSLLKMLMSDAKNMRKHNPIQGGIVDLKANTDIKLLNNIQKLFKVDFEVNK